MASSYARHRPFEKALDEIAPEELGSLRDVHEGWYVEYKSEAPVNRALAKSLSAFANTYGGFLFIGVSTEGSSNVASSFPGIDNSELDVVLERLRDSSKDQLNPPVFFDTRTFEGPINSIGLKVGRSIIVARIPQGSDTPYVHNDGRIYMRVSDSSDPRPETDRATLDLLNGRREKALRRLEERVLQTPTVSKGESNQPFIHFNILSDPYEFMGHSYNADMAEFSNIMQGGGLAFDNIFRSNEGFVARQIEDNDPFYRGLTWEFSRRCHSRVTVPIPVQTRRGPISEHLECFLSELDDFGLNLASVLDLNQVMMIALNVIVKHRRLARRAGVYGPFYIKAYIENVWRTVPFLDLDGFIQATKVYGFPLIQESEMLVPIGGVSLDEFIHLPERNFSGSLFSDESLEVEDIDGIVADTVSVSIRLLMALGIGLELIPNVGDLVSRYVNVSDGRQ